MTRSLFVSAVICGLLAATSVHAADETFDSNGVKIRYVTEGTGEAVVLIHGWMADSSMWGRDATGQTRLDAKNAEGFQLIALDCRGHGQSDKPHDPAKYDAEVAGDVVRLLDHLKVEKAHLVGYSSGAFVAGKVAAMHPDRVLSVVYAGQAPLIGEPKPGDFAQVEAFARLVDEGKDLGEYIIAITPPDRPKPTEEQAKLFARMLYGNKDVKALALAGRGFKHLAATQDQLKQCPAPILFIHGENESEYVRTRVAQARELLARGEVRVIAGGDHMTTLAKPEFGAALMEFLRANKTR